MTLILTELTPPGVVMVADSAISYELDGKVVTANKEQWEKLFTVPSVGAGVSYWGAIGKVTPRDFPNWLREVLGKTGQFSDLQTLAEHLARALNTNCGDKPLPNGADVGLHVAGFAPWRDGVLRPTVYHVHNRHSEYRVKTDLWGARGQPLRRRWSLVAGAMGLFEARLNFPDDKPVDVNVATLKEGGFFLQNGDYFPYTVVSRKLYEAFAELSTFDGCRIPRDPDNLPSRMGFHRMVIETIINLYEMSSLPKRIGRPIVSLAINADGDFMRGTNAEP